MESRETETLPNLPQGAIHPLDDYVTSLRVMGNDVDYPLPPQTASFTLGAESHCDVVVPSAHVSGVHCLLTRRGGRIRVADQHSHNGTYFLNRREQQFDIGPGDVFSASAIQFLAMTRDMRATRDVLAEIASTDQNEPGRFVDEILASTMRGPHVMIIGEPGCDQERLALSLHRASMRRAKFIEVGDVPTDRKLQRKIVDDACNGAVCVTLKGQSERLDEAFLSMLLSNDFRVRLFVLAPTLSAANNALGFHVVSRMLQIPLLPIRERAGDVPALLDRILAARNSALRFSDLKMENQQELLKHTWPQNFVELRDVAVRLVALHEHGSAKRAATVLGLPRSTFQYWVNRMKLVLPLAESHAGAKTSPAANQTSPAANLVRSQA